jgi:Fe-S oxidoreductase
MLSPAEKIVLSLLVLATVFAFFLPVLKRIRILLSCQPENRFKSPIKRFFYALFRVFLQLCTLKNERILTGLAHVMIFYGALAFDTMTVNHILEGYVDGFYLFNSSRFGLIFSAAVDFFAITVLLGVSFFAFKRFVLRPKGYNTTPGDSALIYAFIFLATVTYIYFESFMLANHPGGGRLAFISEFLVDRFNLTALFPTALSANLKLSYWFHTLTVFSFIAYVPHSKYFHLFAGPVNLFFKKHEPSGTIKPINIETAENFGTEKVTDFTWKDALDSFACVECGRCQDVCPAFQSGKALSPKMIILNLETHLFSSYSPIRAKEPEKLSPLVPGVFKEEEIWVCTTCGACLHVCPFDIEHPEKLISLRQNLVLSQGRFPTELRTFFHNLETYSNPWGLAPSQRPEWAKELGVKTVAEAPEASYLLWIGCFGSFDEQGKKITRSVVEILKAAGVSFAILGEEEHCCGDSARRLGNEYLFQNLAQENLRALAKYKVPNLITFCPHGYNVLKNEYPVLVDMLGVFSAEEKEFVKSMRVISHVEFLARLLKENLIPLNQLACDSYTYHDSCYYGRHNGLFDQPRQILSAALAGQLDELNNSREHSFCCGAGGGLMWLEEKAGQRVNHLRSEEIIKNGSQLVATSCPFCLTMLQDGLRDKGAEEIKVLDVAQILAQALNRQSHPE